MRKNLQFIRWIAVFLLGTGFLESQAQPAQGKKPARNTVAGELVVEFKRGASDIEIEQSFRSGRLKPKRHLQTKAMRVKGESGLTLVETEEAIDEVMERLSRHPAVAFVEPNYRYTHQAISNDPYVGTGHTWGLYGNVGSPANQYGSQAVEAWSAGHTGSSSIFVAVLDEGIDIAHPDLTANIWTNPFDPVDGIDNDGNGYVDDVHGWDFLGNTNVVFDAAGDQHGTHVAGTIGAKGGNSSGVAGINWNVTIIPGKFLGPDGGTTLEAVEAIDYMVELKKRHAINLVAINASWGGTGYSRALHSAVIRAAKEGILFIAAAGNEGVNNDSTATYPASLDTRVGTTTETAATYDAVISVAAISQTGALAGFSNFGTTQVDVGAPGVGILSTLPNGQFAYMSGTSMATPHVSGAIALYASTHPGASAASIRNAVLGAGLPTSSLSGKTVTGARLDLSSVITPPPSAPTAMSAVAGNAVVNLTWSAVSGAISYTVLRSQQNGGPYTTINSVNSTAYSDTSVANGTTYYYVVAAVNQNEAGTFSAQVSACPKAPVVALSNMLGDDDSTSGSWRGVYGLDGAFAYPGGTFTAPSFVKLGGYRNYPLTWATSTTDERALMRPSGTDRFATAWNSVDSLYFYLNLTDGEAHEISFYFVDFDRQGRDQLLEFFDHTSGALLGSERISGFEEGRYSSWVLQGNVRLKLTRIAGPNCVLSGIFFDPVGPVGPFVKADTVTSGSWKTAYASEGGLGYPGGNFISPSYVQLSAYKNYGLLWAASTTDSRALQKRTSTTDRVAGAWHSADELFFNLQFADALARQVSFYFVDYDRAGREQKVEIFDRTTGELLDTRILSNFENGVYLTYQLDGNIRLKVTRLAGPNCAMSAILFDPAAP